MSLFAIGDTHLSLGTNKPMDIFSGWFDYVARLEKNWRDAVSPEDTVVIPGDVSWGMDLMQALPDFQFLNSLPGKKLLLKGNHDYWWTTRRKMDAFLLEQGLTTLSIVHNSAVACGPVCVCGTRGWFFDAEKDADKKVLLREAGRLRASIRAAKETGLTPVVFLHYPPLNDAVSCPELLSVLEEEGVRRCFYGHLHGGSIRRAFQGERCGVLFTLVSGDSLRFRPLLIEKF